MKKLLFGFICLILALSVVSRAGVSSASISWYTCPRNDKVRPDCPAEAYFLEDYDSYYLGQDEKTIYLTFDLGYENENVFTILDALKKHNAPAAFFVLKHEVETGKAIDRIINEGHLVCNHTAHHPDMSKMQDKKSFENELLALEECFYEKTGKNLARYYRPPKGVFSEQNLQWAKELQYKTVFWSMTIADWDNNNQLPPETALNKLLSRVHNGAILLLHPVSDTNAKIMDSFLTSLEKEGYTFSSLDEL